MAGVTKEEIARAKELDLLTYFKLVEPTVRAAFMPDSTLEFLPIFSGSKCTKTSIFSGFLHSLQWFDPQKFPRCFPG